MTHEYYCANCPNTSLGIAAEIRGMRRESCSTSGADFADGLRANLPGGYGA